MYIDDDLTIFIDTDFELEAEGEHPVTLPGETNLYIFFDEYGVPRSNNGCYHKRQLPNAD